MHTCNVLLSFSAPLSFPNFSWIHGFRIQNNSITFSNYSRECGFMFLHQMLRIKGVWNNHKDNTKRAICASTKTLVDAQNAKPSGEGDHVCWSVGCGSGTPFPLYPSQCTAVCPEHCCPLLWAEYPNSSMSPSCSSHAAQPTVLLWHLTSSSSLARERCTIGTTEEIPVIFLLLLAFSTGRTSWDDPAHPRTLTGTHAHGSLLSWLIFQDTFFFWILEVHPGLLVDVSPVLWLLKGILH